MDSLKYFTFFNIFEQFTIFPFPMKHLFFSYANPSLFMLLTLISLFLISIPIFLMNNSLAARKRSSLSTTTIGGAAGGSSGGEDDEQRRRKVSSACKKNVIRSVRELIIELYVNSGMKPSLKGEHSNRWNWALSTIYAEKFETPQGDFGELANWANILLELSTKGDKSEFFRRTIRLLKQVQGK